MISETMFEPGQVHDKGETCASISDHVARLRPRWMIGSGASTVSRHRPVLYDYETRHSAASPGIRSAPAMSQ